MSGDRVLTELTQARLKLTQAQLEERACRLRSRQTAVVPTSPTAGALAREIRSTQRQADDWAAVIEAATAAGLM